MFENLRYKFQNRNSNKNLKAEIKELEETLQKLRKETFGGNGMGWITFSYDGLYGSKSKKRSDDSLQGQINDIREYLGLNYSESKLTPKPKDKTSND